MYDVCCLGTRVFNETCVVYTQSRPLLVVSSYRNLNVLSEEERRHFGNLKKTFFQLPQKNEMLPSSRPRKMHSHAI